MADAAPSPATPLAPHQQRVLKLDSAAAVWQGSKGSTRHIDLAVAAVMAHDSL